MSRIAQKFAELKRAGRRAFIPFVTAGDPNLDVSLEIVMKLAELGADVIELGVPFSDPMADGPTIQRSSQRALENGMNLAGVLKLVENVRKQSDVPIVLFSYLNPLMQFGLETLRDRAAAIGIDGILVTDAIDEEARKFAGYLAEKEIDLISLIAPTTTDERLKNISDSASGFIYAVSRSGVTGARQEMSATAETLVERARKFTDLPIAVGFGISTREQIADVWRFADAAVVGSAIVAEVAKATELNDVLQNVEKFVSDLLPEFARTDAGH